MAVEETTTNNQDMMEKDNSEDIMENKQEDLALDEEAVDTNRTKDMYMMENKTAGAIKDDMDEKKVEENEENNTILPRGGKQVSSN